MANMFAAKVKRTHAPAASKRWSAVIVAVALPLGLSACAGNPAEQLEAGALAPRQSADSKVEQRTGRLEDKSATLPALKAKHLAAPSDPAAALAYATALKGAGQTKQARDVVAAAHETATTNTELAGALGLLELELGQPAKAQKLLQTAAATPDADWRYHSGLGVALSFQGKQQDARDQFQKALTKSPGNKTILNNLAMTYMMDKKLDQAEGLLKQAKLGDGVPDAVGKNLELAARLRLPAPTADRRAENDVSPQKAVRPPAAN